MPKTCDKRGKIGQLDKRSIERHTFISTIEPCVEREQRACTAVIRACRLNGPDEYAVPEYVLYLHVPIPSRSVAAPARYRFWTVMCAVRASALDYPPIVPV